MTGSRGPSSRTEELAALYGSRSQTALQKGKNSPLSDIRVPDEPPVALEGDARKWWTSLIEMQRDVNAIRNSDSMLLFLTCDSIVTYTKAQESLREHGNILETEKGPITNPAIRIVKDERNFILKALKELGMTTTARSRLSNTIADTRQKAISALDRFTKFDRSS